MDKVDYSLKQTGTEASPKVIEVNSGDTETLNDYPASCQKCGRSDASLRTTVFPYVTSIILVTFRKSWTGIFCNHCRKKEMLQAKLVSMLLGWWGFPFGVLYTLKVLFTQSQGYIPEDANAVYLQGLGAYFLSCGKIIDAEQALAASLWHRYDRELATRYQQLFERKPQPPTHVAYGQGSGFLFGLVTIVLSVLILTYILPDGRQSTLKPIQFPTLPPTFEPSPTPLPVATPKSLLTSNGVLPAKSAPTLKVIQAKPPRSWKKYVSKQTRFAAYLPPNFIPEEHAPKEGNPARASSFAPDAHNMGPDSTVVSVIYIPYLDIVGQEPTEAELREFIEKWLAKDGLKIIAPPMKLKDNKYLGFEVVHQATMTDKQHVVRAYTAFISTHEGLYYIEVAGFVDHDSTVKQYYDTFMKWFQPVSNE